MEEIDVLLENIEKARTRLNNSIGKGLDNEEVMENSIKLDDLLAEYIEKTEGLEQV